MQGISETRLETGPVNIWPNLHSPRPHTNSFHRPDTPDSVQTDDSLFLRRTPVQDNGVYQKFDNEVKEITEYR